MKTTNLYELIRFVQNTLEYQALIQLSEKQEDILGKLQINEI